jgi:hypothetical protein
MAASNPNVPGAGRRCFITSSSTTRTEADERFPVRRKLFPKHPNPSSFRCRDRRPSAYLESWVPVNRSRCPRPLRRPRRRRIILKKLDGQDHGHLSGIGADIVGGARDAGGPCNAAKTKHRNATDVRRESHPIDQSSVNRGTANAG